MGSAAIALHDLINSKSTTPSVADIERTLAAHRPATQAMISALAAELAGSFKLLSAMERGETAAKAVSDLKHGKDEEGSSAARRLSYDYEDIKNEVHIRTGVLEQAILSSEPQTASEVLSLLLVTVSELETYANTHCDLGSNEEALQDWIRLERATRAVVRGLVNVCEAGSPLLETYFVDRHLSAREQVRERLLKCLPEIVAERAALENERQA